MNLKICAFGIIVFAFFIIGLANVYAEGTASRVITSYMEETNKSLFEQNERTIDVNPNILNSGTNLQINEKDLIRFLIYERDYPLFAQKISAEEVILLTAGYQQIILNTNGEGKTLQIINENTGAQEIIELKLNSISENSANLHIQMHKEETGVTVDYKELFDIDVEISSNEIYSASELTSYIKFYNFGEGPSRINIKYSIFDGSGKEYYQGIDEKTVYTEDSVIKTFDFLKLAPGNYTLSAEIFYGKNQTASSQKSFQILPAPSYKKLMPFILFAILILFGVIIYEYRKHLGKSSKDEKY